MIAAGAPPATGDALEIANLRIEARFGETTRTIVSGADLVVRPGETIGIVGESGSGKSMTARAIMGLLPGGVRASGTLTYGGRDLLALSRQELAALRGSEISLVFQDPFTMLSPLRRCGDQVTETLRDERGRRLSRARRREEAVRRLKEVGIHDPHVADAYPFQLSGGMRQRVGIAAALAGDPELLIADEPTTALDVTTQKEILALLKSLQQSRGMAMILITHDLRVAFAMCDRIHVMYAGSVMEVGRAAAIEEQPLHPYTLGLILSEPPLDRRVAELPVVKGSVPDPDDVTSGCWFAPRCRWAQPRCVAERPPLAEVEPGRMSACVRIGEIFDELRRARGVAAEAAGEQMEPAASDALVRTEGLCKCYRTSSRGGGQREVHALRDVSIAIGPGESVGIVGESGSGKTTLARCLLGLEQADSGTLTIGGLDALRHADLTRGQRRELRGTVQIVHQDPYSSLNPVRSIGRQLKEALNVSAAPSDGRTVADLLELVGLPAAYARRRPIALSGGERQRIAMARALAVQPRLLVCDEPVSALDVSVQAQVLTLLRTLQDELGLSLLVITHDLAVVRQVVERAYVMYRGEVVEAGPVGEILDRPRHDYTKRLIASVPQSSALWIDDRVAELVEQKRAAQAS